MLYDARYRLSRSLQLNSWQQELIDLCKHLTDDQTHSRFDSEPQLIRLCEKAMLQLTSPSVSLPKQLGNLYTGSLYSALLSVLATEPLALVRTKSLIASECDSNHKGKGEKIFLFSYGSGCTSSAFLVEVKKSLSPLKAVLSGLAKRLEDRTEIAPGRFLETLNRLERQHEAPFYPTSNTNHLLPGTFFLDHTNDLHQRFYLRK